MVVVAQQHLSCLGDTGRVGLTKRLTRKSAQGLKEKLGLQTSKMNWSEYNQKYYFENEKSA